MAVIGGGNVAIDVSRTALRLGVKEVHLVCLESREEMTAFEEEVQQAADEGVELNVSWGPKRIYGDNGRVSGIELRRCISVFDKACNFNTRKTRRNYCLKFIKWDLIEETKKSGRYRVKF